MASKREPRQQVDFNHHYAGNLRATGNKRLPNPKGPPNLRESLFSISTRKIKLRTEALKSGPTPKTYISRSGDMIYCGYLWSIEQYYEATVNPDDLFCLDTSGRFRFSGKSIEEAQGIIKNRVARYYPDFRFQTQVTFSQVTLGNVRYHQSQLFLASVRLPAHLLECPFPSYPIALYAAGGQMKMLFL